MMAGPAVLRFYPLPLHLLCPTRILQALTFLSGFHFVLGSLVFIVGCWITELHKLLPRMTSVLRRAVFPPTFQKTATAMKEHTMNTIAWALTGSKTLAGPCLTQVQVAKGVPTTVGRGQDIANSTTSSVDVQTLQTPPGEQPYPEERDQHEGKQRVEGEEKLEEEEEEVDILAYPPPEALTQFPSSAPETIRMVMESALENIAQQTRIEKQRTEEAATQRAEDAKGKGKARAGPPKLTIPSIQVADAVDPTPRMGSTTTTEDDRSLKSPGRPRFRLRRIFHHLVERGETKGETSLAGSADVPDSGVSVSGAGNVAETPSPFTQFIYKHLHAKPAQPPNQGSEEITCVSCFEDLPPKASIKTICHLYCKTCFNMLISTAIANPIQWPPKCCLNPIPYRTITKHATRDLLKRYKQKHAELSLPASDRLYCPAPDCGEWISRINKLKKTARCTQGHSMCIRCRQAPHATPNLCPKDPNHAADRALIDQLASEEGWRRCLDCGILVEHREACQHMTCRCGAQFCYVCGTRWRSCQCTTEQLGEIKQRAEVRRAERRAQEVAEEAWLVEALRGIEQLEREEEMERERRREEREERREERARREQVRVAAVGVKYEGMREVLGDIDGMQRGVLVDGQGKERRGYEAWVLEERCRLAREQEREKERLRLSTAEQMEQRKQELEHEYRGRVAWEKQIEEKYRRVLDGFWAKKANGQQRVGQAMLVFMERNDEQMDRWCRWRDDELEKVRYAVGDEMAVREELMEAMRQRHEEMLAEEERDMKRKHAAEAKWFDLVVDERRRLLAEADTVERENGGENDEESMMSMSDDESFNEGS